MSPEAAPSRSWARTLVDSLSSTSLPAPIRRHQPFSPSNRWGRLGLVPLAACLAVMCSSCSSNSDATTQLLVQNLTLTPSGWQTSILVGQTQLLRTSIEDANGQPVSGITLSYSSSDSTVLSVSTLDALEGVATALRPGTATITVTLTSDASGTANAQSASAKVTSRLAGVEISGSGSPLRFTAVGDTAVVSARGLDVHGTALTGMGLTWQLKGSGIVSLTPFAGGDSARVVSAGEGTDTVEVSHALCQGTCDALLVVQVHQAVASIEVTPASETVTAGDSVVFGAMVRDARGAEVSGAPIRWSVGDTTLARVDSVTGMVWGRHVGTTPVTASTAAVHGGATVHVTAGPAAALAFTVEPSDTSVDHAISPAVEVSEVDAWGNLVGDASGAIAVALGPNLEGATLAGTTTRDAAQGVATFDDLSVNAAGYGYTLVAHATGLDSAVSTPFAIRSHTPVAHPDADTTLENAPLVVAAPGVLANDVDADGSGLKAQLVSSPSHGTLTLNADGSFTYTPASNYAGTDRFTYQATSPTHTSQPATVSLTVTFVNQAPSYTAGGNVTSLEDAGAQSGAWATAISPGPANEAGQAVSFTVTNDNNALFSVQPAISSTGTLTYTAAPDSNGVATVSVQLRDNGGTANGGVDSTTVSTFTITVTAVNDAPSFTKGGNQVLWHGVGAQSVASWATNISPGPANESSQTVSFTVTNNDNALFSVQPAISSTGTLTFTPDPSANGTATVSVTLKDTGGTANGGVDTSSTQTFTIAVGPVALVTNERIGTVSVINLATQTVVKTLTGFGTPEGVAISPDGTKAYVANNSSDKLSVIDMARDSVTNTIQVVGWPSEVAFRPNGTLAYVTEDSAKSVAVVNVSGDYLSGGFAAGSQPEGVAFSHDGLTAYIVNAKSNSVSVKDVVGTSLEATIPVGEFPLYVAVSGNKAYVSNEGLFTASDSVSVIDVAADTTFTKAIKVTAHPRGIAFTPDGSKAYVVSSPSDYGAGVVSVVDVATNSVKSTITVGATPQKVAFTLDGKTAVVTNLYGSSVSVIDVATGTVIKTITIPGFTPEPFGVAIH